MGKNSSISSKHVHCCINKHTKWSKRVHCCIHASLIFFLRVWEFALHCTCVPGRVCAYLVCVARINENMNLQINFGCCPLLYVRTSVNNTKLKTLILKLNNGVPGCELASYLHARQQQACTLLYTCVTCFFWGGVGILPFIVRTYLVCVA